MSIQPQEFPQGVGWVVTRQEPDQVSFTAPGDPVYGVNVFFQTAIGNSGVVFIPYTHYGDIRAIHAAIGVQARIADSVSRLASNSFPG